MKPNAEEISGCVAALEAAFADCRKPTRSEQLISVGGIDAGAARSYWEKLDRSDFADLREFDFRLGDNLDFLSSDAIRHFLPSFLSLELRDPEVMADFGLSFLTRRLEAMFLREPSHKYYRGATLTKAQRDALCLWCDIVQRVPDPLGLTGTENEIFLFQRTENLMSISKIRQGLADAESIVDFDLEYQSNLTEAAEKTSAGPISRRKGWVRHKGRDARSRKKENDDQVE